MIVIAKGKEKMYLIADLDRDGYDKTTHKHKDYLLPGIELKKEKIHGLGPLQRFAGEMAYTYNVTPEYDSVEALKEFFPAVQAL